MGGNPGKTPCQSPAILRSTRGWTCCLSSDSFLTEKAAAPVD
jgi:hypothetical protein